MPLTLRPTGLSSPAYRDQLDYIVCEDGKAIGRMYDDRRGREQRSPKAWSAPSSNPRSTAGVGQSTRRPASNSPRPLMPMARAAAGRQINDPAAHKRVSIINGHNSGLTIAPVR
jgi:hypothetical protein